MEHGADWSGHVRRRRGARTSNRHPSREDFNPLPSRAVMHYDHGSAGGVALADVGSLGKPAAIVTIRPAHW